MIKSNHGSRLLPSVVSSPGLVGMMTLSKCPWSSSRPSIAPQELCCLSSGRLIDEGNLGEQRLVSRERRGAEDEASASASH